MSPSIQGDWFVSAGLRRHPITIQTLMRTPDGQGGYTETWTDQAIVRAEISPATPVNVERKVGPQIEAKLTHLVTIPYSISYPVSVTSRIKYGTRIFQIHDVVNHEERNVQLTLACEELIL